MRVKATRSFCGLVNMASGEIKDIDDSLAKELIKANHVIEYKEDKPKKKKGAKK